MSTNCREIMLNVVALTRFQVGKKLSQLSYFIPCGHAESILQVSNHVVIGLVLQRSQLRTMCNCTAVSSVPSASASIVSSSCSAS